MERHAKNKARLQRFDELNSQEYQRRSETNEIYIPPGDRLGDSVIELKNVSKSYGDKTLINDLERAIAEIKSEVYSDTSAYRIDSGDGIKSYAQVNDEDGECD